MDSALNRIWLTWHNGFCEDVVYDKQWAAESDIKYIRLDHIIDKLKGLEDEWREAEEEYGKSAMVMNRKINDLAKLRKEIEG